MLTTTDSEEQYILSLKSQRQRLQSENDSFRSENDSLRSKIRRLSDQINRLELENNEFREERMENEGFQGSNAGDTVATDKTQGLTIGETFNKVFEHICDEYWNEQQVLLLHAKTIHVLQETASEQMSSSH